MTWNNLTFLDNTTEVSSVVAGVNEITGGWLIGGLMLTLFIVAFMTFYGRVAVGELLLAEGFFFSIVGLIFIQAGFLPLWVLGITISIAIFGVISIFMSD